jgi:CheY-like chemotaxis protein
VLIIHPDEKKATELLKQCHKISFIAVVAASINNGILLAEKYAPKAIIIAAELNTPKEYEKLITNKSTCQIPIHHVSRVEEDTLNHVEELITPSSNENNAVLNNIESRLINEFDQVLIVEDDPATQLALHLLFKNKNIIIHEAKTGKQAYEMITTKKFDCVILDLGLPDFSGTVLLEKLNSNKIPIPYVIIHTARELTKTEIRELNKYSDSIVIKGIKSDERLMDEVSLFLHQIKNKHPETSVSVTNDFSANSGFKGKKILLVDDDIRNIFALAQILEEKEIEILEAENGEVAIEVLKNNSDIDLILMDIMMPVMDGYNAMKIIRSMPEIKNIPIITLTAKAMKEDYQKAIDCGANDYISKPLDIEKLFELLKIWLFK